MSKDTTYSDLTIAIPVSRCCHALVMIFPGIMGLEMSKCIACGKTITDEDDVITGYVEGYEKLEVDMEELEK